MDYTTVEKDYHSQLLINAVLPGIPGTIKIICVSESRNTTSYELFDENGESMSHRRFDCSFGPVARQFNSMLTEELNILLESWGITITEEQLKAISELAVKKCESRYGNNIDDGDCIIILNPENC